MQVKLDHRGFKAVLDFSITDEGIYYSDSTMHYEENEDDPFSEGEWVKSRVPDRWLRYLQNDVNTLLPTAGVVYSPSNKPVLPSQ